MRDVQVVEGEWVGFPGGELEGKRPKVMCAACRAALQRASQSSRRSPTSPVTHPPLCFQCYRAELERERALRAAGDLDTASEARFQSTLPFEPVNTVRLEMLKAERATSREAARQGSGSYAERRRRAQIDARHALQEIFAGVKARQLQAATRDRYIAFATRAAELQLPEAWLPFVVSR